MHRRPALNLIATLYFIGQSEDFPIEQKKTPYPLTGTDVLDSAVPPLLTAVFLPPSLCFSNAKAHVLLLSVPFRTGTIPFHRHFSFYLFAPFYWNFSFLSRPDCLHFQLYLPPCRAVLIVPDSCSIQHSLGSFHCRSVPIFITAIYNGLDPCLDNSLGTFIAGE